MEREPGGQWRPGESDANQPTGRRRAGSWLTSPAWWIPKGAAAGLCWLLAESAGAFVNTSSGSQSRGASMNSGLQLGAGIGLVLVMTWFAGISDQTGYVSVAVIFALWFLWAINNNSRLSSFLSALHGG